MGDHKIEIPTGTLTIRSALGVKVKRPTDKRPYIEQKVGDDLHRKTNTWNRIERVINRDDDRYREVVTNADGEIIHECEEPLSKHRGRGDAKGRK